MSSPDIAAVARSAIEVACGGQLDRVPEFYDPDFVDHVNARIVEDHGATDSLAFLRALGPARCAALLADVVRGRVKLPRGALSG